MPKARDSNKEGKKQPAMTMKEKRAAKKSKKQAKSFLGNDNAMRTPPPSSAAKRP